MLREMQGMKKNLEYNYFIQIIDSVVILGLSLGAVRNGSSSSCSPLSLI